MEDNKISGISNSAYHGQMNTLNSNKSSVSPPISGSSNIHGTFPFTLLLIFDQTFDFKAFIDEGSQKKSKVIMLGSSGVGKTSIIQRYCE